MINQIQFSLFLVLLKIKYLCTQVSRIILINSFSFYLKSLASPPVFRPRLWWAWTLQGQHWNMWDDIQNSLSKLNWKYFISSFPRCTQYFKPIPEPQVAFFWWVTRLLISSSSLVTSTLLSIVMQSCDVQYRTRVKVARVTCMGDWLEIPDRSPGGESVTREIRELRSRKPEN